MIKLFSTPKQKLEVLTKEQKTYKRVIWGPVNRAGAEIMNQSQCDRAVFMG